MEGSRLLRRGGKVVSHEKTGASLVKGRVSGSEGNCYDVVIDLDHPKKSTCNCPFAEGRRVVCKHMVALYFTSVPGSFEDFEEDVRCAELEYQEQEEEWRASTLERIERDVAAMPAAEARRRLVTLLYNIELEDRYYNDDYW